MPVRTIVLGEMTDFFFSFSDFDLILFPTGERIDGMILILHARAPFSN